MGPKIHQVPYYLLLLLYIVPFLAHSDVNPCHSKLLKDCVCGKVYADSRSYFAVNCTNQGFNNTDMLEELPEQTQMLIFRGNHIPVLKSNIFGDIVDLSDLTVIDMSNNGIREIKGKAFHHVLGVERLILNHNNISISDEDEGNFHHPRVFSNFYNLKELHLTNAFADNTDAALADDLHDIFVNSNLTKLYKLHLEQNEIKNFRDRKVFCDLPDLHDIYLGDNNIPSLNFDIDCLKKLRYLDLERNNITMFRQEDLNTFDRLAQPYRQENLMLEIEGNPFRCDQAIRNLYNWLQKTKVQIRNKDQVKCHQAHYGDRYIVNLKNLAQAKQAKTNHSMTVLFVVLGFVIVSLMAAVVYIRRMKIPVKWGPIMDAFSKKVQYTTIESQADNV